MILTLNHVPISRRHSAQINGVVALDAWIMDLNRQHVYWVLRERRVGV